MNKQEEWVKARMSEFKDIFSSLGDEQLSIISEWVCGTLDSAWKRGYKEGHDESLKKF